MYTSLVLIFLLVSIVLIGMIVLQQGKGTDMGGASFAAGASTTLFGSSGSGNFITRITAILAALFFVISLILGNFTANKDMISRSKWKDIEEPIKVEKSVKVPTKPIASTSDIPH